MKKKKNDPIILDFDGVLHSYCSGWKGATVILDPPVPGMAEACHALVAEGYTLIVMSSRARYPGASTAITKWLEENGFPRMMVTSEKIPGGVYIDDRGYRFNGDPGAMLTFIRGGLTPWNKGAQIEEETRKSPDDEPGPYHNPDLREGCTVHIPGVGDI